MSTNPEDARLQIEAITGDPDAPVRIRTVHSSRDKRESFEFEGPIAKIGSRAEDLNAAGHNVYMVANRTRGGLGKHFARNSDVIEVRALFADGDDKPLPETWHAAPTFTLLHPATKRWWSFWATDDVALNEFTDLQKRIVQQYGSDPRVTNLARIVRLAGFDRWKDGKSYGPYRLVPGHGQLVDRSEHDCLPPLPPRAKAQKGAYDVDQVIAEWRLRELLERISPASRDDWRNVCFVLRDVQVINDDFELLDDFDKCALFDEWAAGSFWSAAP